MQTIEKLRSGTNSDTNWPEVGYAHASSACDIYIVGQDYGSHLHIGSLHPWLQVFLLKVRWKAVLFKNTAYIYSLNTLIDITLLNWFLNGTEFVVSCEEWKEEGIVCQTRRKLILAEVLLRNTWRIEQLFVNQEGNRRLCWKCKLLDHAKPSSSKYNRCSAFLIEKILSFSANGKFN